MSFIVSKMSDIARQAMIVALDNSLVSILRNEIPTLGGRDLVRLAFVAERNLKLSNDLQPLLLRWGYSQTELHRSLTCCPERIEILQKIDPDWLVKNVRSFLPELLLEGGHLHKLTPDWLLKNVGSGGNLMFCLSNGGHLAKLSPDWIVANIRSDLDKVTALRDGGHLDIVTPDWLRKHIQNDQDLVSCLHDGDQLARVSPEWIVTNFRSNPNRIAALSTGGHLSVVSPDWIFDNIEGHHDALWALSTKMDLVDVPHAWFKQKFPYFEDFKIVADVLGFMSSRLLSWFMNIYDTQYRDQECPASDLACALLEIIVNDKYGGCSFEVIELMTAMRKVPYKELFMLLHATSEVTGVCGLCESFNRPDLSNKEILVLYFKSLGWPVDSPSDNLECRAVCQQLLNKSDL